VIAIVFILYNMI